MTPDDVLIKYDDRLKIKLEKLTQEHIIHNL
jgi:hypothetical protein